MEQRAAEESESKPVATLNLRDFKVVAGVSTDRPVGNVSVSRWNSRICRRRGERMQSLGRP